MNRICSSLIRPLVAAALLAVASPAFAQDGTVIRQILGHIGLFPAEKDPIDYRERPGLVVPKDTTKLRTPEESDPTQRNARWPDDPDVRARREAEAKRNAVDPQLLGRRTVDGRRLTIDEMAAGRVPRGTVLGEPAIPGNDKREVRLPPEEWSRISRNSTQTAQYPPGTEPPRQYLTDPPRGLRVPAANAPVARTQSDPGAGFDNFRPDVWTTRRD